MEKERRMELSEENLEQISGGSMVGIQKRSAGKSKVWCNTCKAYVEVAAAGSGGRTRCSKGSHYIDEL